MLKFQITIRKQQKSEFYQFENPSYAGKTTDKTLSLDWRHGKQTHSYIVCSLCGQTGERYLDVDK